MASSSSSSRLSSQIKAATGMIHQAKLDVVEETRIMLMDAKRKLECALRMLLEVDPHERLEEIEYLIVTLDNQLLRVCEEEAVMDVNTGNAEQEVVILDTSEIEKSAGPARTAVEGMKMERRKGKELGVCPICMQELRLVRVTPCSHSFHSVCMFKWLSGSIGSNSGSSPICRSYLLPISHSDAAQ